eukprot:4633114-Alexandrium_andersonii.AAC.1
MLALNWWRFVVAPQALGGIGKQTPHLANQTVKFANDPGCLHGAAGTWLRCMLLLPEREIS